MDFTIRYADSIGMGCALTFEPYQSLLLRIDQGKVEFIDISFDPKIPVVRERPDEYEALWLVGE